MQVHHIGWHRQGSADEVIIIVDVPHKEALTPDYFFEHQCLMLYGRRTGKLRSKLINLLEMLIPSLVLLPYLRLLFFFIGSSGLIGIVLIVNKSIVCVS